MLPAAAWLLRDHADVTLFEPDGVTPIRGSTVTWGFHDVHGLVWEWCEDTWHDSFEDAPSDGVTPAAEAPATGSQDDVATPPTASPVVAQPETVILSDSPEYLATVGTGPDGLPIVASQRFLPGDDFGTVRLFFCTNAACDDYEVVDVVEEQWLGRELEFTVAPSGDIYLMYGGFDDGEKVMVYRDSELTEVALPFNFPSGEGHAMAILPSAFPPIVAGASFRRGPMSLRKRPAGASSNPTNVDFPVRVRDSGAEAPWR